MKNFRILFIFLIIILLIPTTANASTVKIIAQALDSFYSKNPPNNFKVKVIKTYNLKNEEKIETDTIFEGVITKVNVPKRGKRNANFYFQITSMTPPNQRIDIPIKDTLKTAKVVAYTPTDYNKMVGSGIMSAIGFFMKPLVLPINFSKGVIHPYPQKGRFRSGVQTAYEGSIFSYISKGKDLKLNEGDKLTLIFHYDKKDSIEDKEQKRREHAALTDEEDDEENLDLPEEEETKNTANPSQRPKMQPVKKNYPPFQRPKGLSTSPDFQNWDKGIQNFPKMRGFE